MLSAVELVGQVRSCVITIKMLELTFYDSLRWYNLRTSGLMSETERYELSNVR